MPARRRKKAVDTIKGSPTSAKVFSLIQRSARDTPHHDVAEGVVAPSGGVPKEEQEEKELGRAESRSGTVITERWVVFDEEVEGHSGNPILSQRPERSRPSSSWVPTEDNGRAGVPLWNTNLTELI